MGRYLGNEDKHLLNICTIAIATVFLLIVIVLVYIVIFYLTSSFLRKDCLDDVSSNHPMLVITI
jgi:heme/copper-type cytochrome/quinol oxidase subunit 2